MCYCENSALFEVVPYRILDKGIGAGKKDTNLALLRTHVAKFTM